MNTMQSKTCIFSFFLLLSFFFISASAQPKSPRGVLVSQLVTVDPKPGKANYTTVGAALAAAPTNLYPHNGYYVITIARGVYPEYITVPYNKMHIMMIGAGIGRTIITGSKSAADGFGTYGSATFSVDAPGFIATKITFRNTAGAAKQQAVAVRNSAERSAFYRCSFEGYQATLYAHSNTQFYKMCDIYGTVDIIFGNAAAVFQSCNIIPRIPLPVQYNTITAHARSSPTENTGFVFQWCKIDAPVATKTYLGRPWGTAARTVFMQCYLGPMIAPAGWLAWSGDSAPATVYYAEYANEGPGAVTTYRVKWAGFHVIDAAAAQAFTVMKFIVGKLWLPGTGVPFTEGLKH